MEAMNAAGRQPQRRNGRRRTSAPTVARLEAPASASSHRQGGIAVALGMMQILVEQDGDLSSLDISASLAIRPSQTHRVLQPLLAAGYIAYDSERRVYGIGSQFLRLAAKAISDTPIASLARPLMEELARSAQEAVYLYLYDARCGCVRVAAIEDGPQPLHYALEFGAPLLMHAGASGKSVLAFLPPAEIERVVEQHGLPQLTSRTITSRNRLLADLAAIRAAGFAFSRGERIADAVGIAAPVFGVHGSVVASLQVTKPRQRFKPGDKKRVVPLVVGYARQLSVMLGHGQDPERPPRQLK